MHHTWTISPVPLALPPQVFLGYSQRFYPSPMRTCYLFSTSIASRDSNPDKKVLIFFPLRSMFYRFRADITPPVLPIEHTCKNRNGWILTTNNAPVHVYARSTVELHSVGVRPPTRGRRLIGKCCTCAIDHLQADSITTSANAPVRNRTAIISRPAHY